MAAHSSILAWGTPWTEQPGRLESTGSQRVGHNQTTKTHTVSLLIVCQDDLYSDVTGLLKLPYYYCFAFNFSF